MMRKILFTLAMLAVAPLSLQAQSPDDAARRLESALARAVDAGIPVELLQTRIAEGRAKGVSEERIAFAVERRAAGLAKAQEALASALERPSAEEISAGADALEAGADGQTLRAVIEAARAEDRPVALAVLGELVNQGLPVQEALERVTTALEQRGDALANLPQQAAAARERRGAPEGAGRPGGVGGAPAGMGGPPAVTPGGPPSDIPAPTGKRPGGGNPTGTGGGI